MIWNEKPSIASERSGKIFHTFSLRFCLLWRRWLWLWRQRRSCSSAPKWMKKWNLCQWQKEENEKQWHLKAILSGACKTNNIIPYSTRQDIQYFRVCNVWKVYQHIWYDIIIHSGLHGCDFFYLKMYETFHAKSSFTKSVWSCRHIN